MIMIFKLILITLSPRAFWCDSCVHVGDTAWRRAQRVQKIKIFDKRNIVESSVDKKEGLITANFGT